MGALALALSAGPAFAQTASGGTDQAQTAKPGATAPATGGSAQANDDTTVDQAIIITGVRASVSSALDLRRTAPALVESIVAEDIGKLPDNNVVEALQHVTGVSILRTAVENSTVLIRGLPDVATTLNNRQIFTSSSRTISLPDLPAELLARVDVKKSPTADDQEGGIAGVINVALHRPFDFKGLQVAGTLKGTYGELIKKVSPQGSILLSDRWDTGIGEIGILVNAAYQRRYARTDQFVNQGATWRQSRGPVTGAGSGPATVGTPPNGVPAGYVAYPATITLYQQLNDIKRTTISSSLQWRPASNFDAYVDYFYAGLRSEPGTQVNVILMTTCPTTAGTQPFPGTNVAQVLPNGCYGLTSMQARRTREDTHQIAGGFNWDATSDLKVTAQANYTTSKDSTDSHIVDAQYNLGPQGLTVTVNPDGKGAYYVSQPGDPQADPANTYIDQWYDIVNPRKGHEYAGRIDATYTVPSQSFIRSLAAGYRYNSRQATSDQGGTGLNCASVVGAGITGGSDPFNKYRMLAMNSPYCVAYRNGSSPQPYTNQAAITRVGGVSYASLGADAWNPLQGSFFGGKYGTSNWVSMDPDWLFTNVETIRKGFGYSGAPDFVPTNHFDVKETANAAYGRLDYGIDFANGMTLDGNIGLRMIRTTLTEAGFTTTYVPADPTKAPGAGANATCITCLVYSPKVGSTTDTQWLPSFNARLKLLTGLYARASFSKTVTRPTFAQLNPGETVSAATATLAGTITSGNPDLKPIESTNYDADLTYYWGQANHIGLSIFYREVKGYIQTQATPVVVDGLNYTRSRPVNYQNGEIKGLEAGYSQFLDFLPGFWSGFGWDVNATYIDAPFNNVPKFHANLTGIYEKHGLSFRLSYTYNSPYRIADFVGGAQPQDRWASVRTNMDASLSYSINSHASVTLDVTNILNSHQREHAGNGAMDEMLYPTTYLAFERTVALGVRFKL
ncbi:MAG: TonB-dependent receptor [Sphingobium sp.]|nr:TonB-dependent receptor [Sphingobium sp.]